VNNLLSISKRELKFQYIRAHHAQRKCKPSSSIPRIWRGRMGQTNKTDEKGTKETGGQEMKVQKAEGKGRMGMRELF
jgi:hypothetical protein